MKLPSDSASLIKLFGMSNQLLDHDLANLEERLAVDLGRGTKPSRDTDEVYYPQFDSAVRAEATRMALHYELFYCLEKTIRSFIAEVLVSSAGPSWWGAPRVPETLQQAVRDRIKKETDAGVTLRSTESIDYTTFGELGELIRSNWDVFGGLFSSQAAVTKVMTNLNTLRGPIAHCTPLADDEVLRLRLSVRDWFRLME